MTMSDLSAAEKTPCPVCCNDTLIKGSRSWIGTQYEPDQCENCGYVQPINKTQYEELGYLTKCWELQVDPLCCYGLFELIEWIERASKGIVTVRPDGITGVQELKNSVEVTPYWKERVLAMVAELHAEWDC